MSKKHFEHAALRIRTLREEAYSAFLRRDFEARNRMVSEANGAEAIVISLGMAFNPRFDVARFQKASDFIPAFGAAVAALKAA